MSIAGQSRSQRGFALLEAVIAAAIFGLIGMLVFGTFSRTMDARDRAQMMTDYYHQARQAMLRMSREIQTAFLSPNKDCDDPRSETLFVAKRSSRGSRLNFTSFSHYKIRADANESDQNEISYFVDQHPDDPQRDALFRREQSPIDDEADEGGIAYVLAEDVKEINFEFYDGEEDRWEDEWDSDSHDFRDSRNRPRLPLFVTIRMKVEDPLGEEEEFVTKTRLLLNRPLSSGVGLGFAECWE